MRVLLDECIPRPLMRLLPGHDVATVSDVGWAGKTNGELLRDWKTIILTMPMCSA